MKAINVHAAKTQFSKLLARVEKGDEILIARAGKPVARLLPYRPRAAAPVFGADRGTLVVPEDFNAALPDAITKAFEGRARR